MTYKICLSNKFNLQNSKITYNRKEDMNNIQQTSYLKNTVINKL